MSWNRIVGQTALTELINGDIGICKQGGVQKDFEMGTLFNSKITGSEVQISKAWGNFNGTGVLATRVSFNVSSITDNGTGNYTVNLTNAMPSTNYVVTVGASSGAAAGIVEPDTLTTTSFRLVCTRADTGAVQDMGIIMFNVVGD